MMSTPGYDVVTLQPAVYRDAAHEAAAERLQDGGSVTIRCLRDTPEDAEFAARMMLEAFREKFVHCVTEQKLDTLLKILTSEHRGNPPFFYSRNFVAEYEGRPAGLVAIKLRGDPEESSSDDVCDLGCYRACRLICFGIFAGANPARGKCYLDHICVDSRFRGKGIGKILMQHAEREARRLNCRVIFLYVVTTNRAIHLYQREGYHVTSTETCCVECCMGVPGAHRMDKTLT